MQKYLSAFLELQEDYRKAASNMKELDEYSPIKEVKVLKYDDGVPAVTMTHMHGKVMEENYSVDKMILVNDETNKTDDDVTLLDEQNHVIEHYHNEGLTIERCGLMTCVALSEACRLLKKDTVNKVGIIGCGKTNLQNAQCIAEIFHVNNFVIRGSEKNRGKNKEKFAEFGNVEVDDTDDLALLNSCDVVVSCTSTCDPKDQISSAQLYGPKIMIALDTGYLLDESFRKTCEAYSDDIDQLNKYYGEEFIFDKDKVKLKQLVRDTKIEKDRICVYMFGISFADAEVAYMRHEHIA